MSKGHRFPYEWRLSDGYPARGIENHQSTVFGTFVCGGGSTMGYKLAGYHHLGGVELDPKVAKVYKLNHHPELFYNMDIRDFNKLQDLPAELYNLDLLDGSPPCFCAGELVMTSAGFKEIQNIEVGDKVLTHNLRYCEVKKTMSRKTNGYYKLKVQGSLPISVTAEHPFYVRTMTSVNNVRKFSSPYWKNVCDLQLVKNTSGLTKKRDYIGVAINSESEMPFFRDIVFDDTLLYVIGRWFGDGWLRIFTNEAERREALPLTKIKERCRVCGKPTIPHSRYPWLYTSYCSEDCQRNFKNQRKKNRHTFFICCSKDKVNELRTYFDKLPYKYCLTEERTTYRFSIENKTLVEYMEQFGRGAENKHLTKDILNLPIDKLKIFLQGYLDSDGHYDKRYDVHVCSSVSKSLIYGIQACVYKVYHTPTRMNFRPVNTEVIEGRKVNSRPSYSLGFKREAVKQQHSIYEDGYLWVPFRSKEWCAEDVDVYNLSVAEDESYNVNNLICHNCSTFSTAGSRDKAWGKEKRFDEGQKLQTLDDLVFVYCDTIKKLHPKCFLLENVSGLIKGNAKSYAKRIVERLTEDGYVVQVFCLNSAVMGVPQARERVFFIGHRKEYTLKKLVLDFSGEPIFFKEIIDYGDTTPRLSKLQMDYWLQRKKSDMSIGDIAKRTSGKNTMFNCSLYHSDMVMRTLPKGTLTLLYDIPRPLNEREMMLASTFPLDYKYMGKSALRFYCGMCVPPVMMAQIAYEIYLQWIKPIKEKF